MAGVVDIISHTLEDYFSKTRANYLLDGFSISIIKTCIKHGKVLLTDPTNYEAKSNIAWASVYAINGIIGFKKPEYASTVKCPKDNVFITFLELLISV